VAKSTTGTRLPYDERLALMRQHGSSGREFKAASPVVTGSTGLDDWEWGVTLFGVHVDDLKDCVYTMRFDEASTCTRNSERFTPDSWAAWMKCSTPRWPSRCW